MQSIRPRVAFCKHNYLPFFIDFLTSNIMISPVFGRRLISTSLPRDRISRMILISFSPMFSFYHILFTLLPRTFLEKRQVYPPLSLHHVAQFVYIAFHDFSFLPALGIVAHAFQFFGQSVHVFLESRKHSPLTIL